MLEEKEEKPEDKALRKIVTVYQKITAKAITTTLNGLNMGLKAYIQGLNYLEQTRSSNGKRAKSRSKARAVNSRENLYNDSCEKLLLLLFVNTA